MSNLIEETKLLKQNKQDLVNALNGIGLAATMETPMSKLAYLLKWASGFAGVPLLTVEKSTGYQRYFTIDEWQAMSDNQKSRYNTVGVCLHAEGRRLMIAGADCRYNGSLTMRWATVRFQLSDLKNYGDNILNIGFYDDFDGRGKTEIILGHKDQSDFPAAEQAHAYKAFEGDTTQWWLPDVSEWRLIDRYRAQVNEALIAFFGTGLTSGNYWTADEHTHASGDYVWAVEASGRLDSYYLKTLSYYVRAVSEAPAI